jgi:hypothetical protein
MQERDTIILANVFTSKKILKIKEKLPASEQEKKKKKDGSPNKRPHPKVQNAQK